MIYEPLVFIVASYQLSNDKSNPVHSLMSTLLNFTKEHIYMKPYKTVYLVRIIPENRTEVKSLHLPYLRVPPHCLLIDSATIMNPEIKGVRHG